MNIKFINLNLLNSLRGRRIDPGVGRITLGIQRLDCKKINKAVIVLPSIQKGTTDKITPGVIRMILHQLFTNLDSRKIKIVNLYQGEDVEIFKYLNTLAFAMREEINSTRLVS